MTDDTIETPVQKAARGSLCRMEVISADYTGASGYVHIGVVDGGSLVTNVIIECLTGSGSCSVGIDGPRGNHTLISSTVSAGNIKGEDPAEYRSYQDNSYSGALWTEGKQDSEGGDWELISLPALTGNQSVAPTHGGVALTGTWTEGKYTRVNQLGISVDPTSHMGLISGASEGTDAAIGGVGLDGSWSVGSVSSLAQGVLSGNQTKKEADFDVTTWARPRTYWVSGDSDAYIQASGNATIRARVFFIASGRG